MIMDGKTIYQMTYNLGRANQSTSAVAGGALASAQSERASDVWIGSAYD